MHVENMKIFPLQTDYHTDGLGVQVNEITPFKLAERVHPARHVRAELEILREDLHLVHGEIGDEHHPVVLHSHHQARVTFVSTWIINDISEAAL